MANEQDQSIKIKDDGSNPQIHLEEIYVVARLSDGTQLGVKLDGDLCEMQMLQDAPAGKWKGKYIVRLEGRNRKRFKVTDHAFRIIKAALG